MLHDPDGHEIRFYTIAHHTEVSPGAATTIADPREAAERREQEQRAAGPPPGDRL